MKTILYSLLIGMGVAVLGWVVVTFLAEILFSGTPKDVASIFGWGVYLVIVITVCSGVIVSYIRKP